MSTKNSRKNIDPVNDETRFQTKTLNTGDDIVGCGGGCDAVCSESATGKGLTEQKVKLERFRLWAGQRNTQEIKQESMLANSTDNEIEKEKSFTS